MTEPTTPQGQPTLTTQGAQEAFRSADRMDLGIVAAGILAFICSMLPFYTVSIGGMGGSESAWHGFFGWFGALCALAGGVVIVLHILKVALPFPVRLGVLGAFAVASLCEILALFVFPGGKVDSAFIHVNYGHGVGYWLTLLACLAGLGLSVVRRDEA